VFLIGNAQIKEKILAGCQGIAIVKRTPQMTRICAQKSHVMISVNCLMELAILMEPALVFLGL